MEELVLSVNGMDCRSCGERIERTVGQLAGVRRVSADHDAGRVSVVVDQAGSEATIRARITGAGFEVA